MTPVTPSLQMGKITAYRQRPPEEALLDSASRELRMKEINLL
jgi:hypothetical protein